MEAMAAALKQAIQERRQPFIEEYVAAQAHAVVDGPSYPPEAIAQMLNGFFSMLIEALDGGPGPTRATFVETITPVLRDSGVSAKVMLGGSTSVVIKVTLDLVAHLPEAHRAAAAAWLAQWFGDYLGDLAEAWAQPRT